MSQHIQYNFDHISLHDRIATHVSFENNHLCFYFQDGIDYIPSNDYDDCKTTPSAEVIFEIHDEITICVFKPIGKKKSIRKEVNLEKFIEKINSEKYRLEFLYRYDGGYNTIFECCIHKDHKPYFIECQIYIAIKNVTIQWKN